MPYANVKVLLLYNPVAGNAMFAKNLDFIIQKFQSKGKMVIPFRLGNKEAMNTLFSKIKDIGFSKIVVAGGDGTLNAVVNLMMKYDVKLPIAVFPSGTANDFASYFGIPSELQGMIRVSQGDEIQPADIGCANGKYFVNVCAFGFPAEVGHKTDQSFKNAVGVMSYYLKGIEQITNFKSYHVKVQSAECSFEEKLFFMVIMNGRSAGGFKKLAMQASIQDGLLDVIAFKECPIIEIGPLLVQILRGEHAESPHVLKFKTNELIVEHDEDMVTDLDGEPGPAGRIHIRSIPEALSVIVPGKK